MASSDIPQIHVQHEQESSYTRPIETDQSSSVNDAQEVQTPTAEAGNGKKPDYVDDIELTGIYTLYIKEYMYMFYCFFMYACLYLQIQML